MTSWRQPVSRSAFAGFSARLACSPVLYIAMKTQGRHAMTTRIIMRLRSSASRTCAPTCVTLAGAKKKVSAAS